LKYAFFAIQQKAFTLLGSFQLVAWLVDRNNRFMILRFIRPLILSGAIDLIYLPWFSSDVSRIMNLKCWSSEDYQK